MMAIHAWDGVRGWGGVLFVIKEDIPRNVLQKDPRGLLGLPIRVGCITDHPYQEQDQCNRVSQKTFFSRFHSMFLFLQNS
jgi:hypothetical protein